VGYDLIFFVLCIIIQCWSSTLIELMPTERNLVFMDQTKSGNKARTPPRTPPAANTAQTVRMVRAENSESGTTLYIPNAPRRDPRQKTAALPAPEEPPKAVAGGRPAKLSPVKRLEHKFKKSGLGKLDSYFNARFFYLAWKGEKKGRKVKSYIKTTARHPKGWSKTKAAGDVYEKNAYDRYMDAMVLFAVLWGFFCAVSARAGKFFEAARSAKHVAKGLLGFLLPAASAALTIAAMVNIGSLAPNLELCFDGEFIGYVESMDAADGAVFALENDISSVLGESYEFAGEFGYRMALAKTERPCVSQGEIYDIIYDSPQVRGAVTTAYGLYIDGFLVIAAESQDDIDKVLGDLLEENSGDIGEGGNIGFANDIEIIKDEYAARDVVSHDELKDIITYSADNAENEALFEIADEEVPLFGGGEFDEYAGETAAASEDIAAIAAASSIELTPEAINAIPRGFLDANEHNAQDEILSRLFRTSASTAAGSLKFKKVKTETYSVETAYETKYVESNQYYKGTQTVKTNGANGENLVTAEVTYIEDKEVSREIKNVETIKEPTDKIVLVGTKIKPTASPTGAFIRPVKGGYISSRFGGGHRGVDLVVPLGSAVSAADGGTVIYTGYSSSYGNHVKIRHSGGFVTLYAHLKSISAKYGDKVYQGQEIGKCGSTGNSTGPHVHFEIIKNGVLVNPESYMK